MTTEQDKEVALARTMFARFAPDVQKRLAKDELLTDDELRAIMCLWGGVARDAKKYQALFEPGSVARSDLFQIEYKALRFSKDERVLYAMNNLLAGGGIELRIHGLGLLIPILDDAVSLFDWLDKNHEKPEELASDVFGRWLKAIRWSTAAVAAIQFHFAEGILSLDASADPQS